MKKKIIIIVGVVFVSLFAIGLVTSYLDSARVRNNIEPKYVIKTISYHGDKVIYWGLGYKVIRYVNISPNEPFKSNRGVKYGSWFMNYEFKETQNKTYKGIKYEKKLDNIILKLDIPEDWKYEELPRNIENDFYKYALKIYKNHEDKYAVLYYYYQMFGVCGTGRTSDTIDLDNGNKATIGYYDGEDTWQDISFYEIDKYIAILNYGLDKEEANEFIGLIKTISIKEINNSQNSNAEG